jgi:phage FluMu protein Com
MASEQFDEFWEVRCPKCKEMIDLEILVNLMRKKIEKVQIANAEEKKLAP